VRPGGTLDSWTFTVISPSCWRANDADVTSAPYWTEHVVHHAGNWAQDEYIDHGPTTAWTGVSLSACGGKASRDVRIGVQLLDADPGGYSLRRFRNGVEVPMAVASESGSKAAGITVWLNADGSQLDANGTWTLEVLTGRYNLPGVTMTSWVLHTSY
jgi:hypothetical protein